MSGEVLAGQLIHKAINRRRNRIEKKYFFSREALVDIYRFLYFVNIAVRSKPTQFVPLDWQCWVIYNTFGYFRDKELTVRLFRYSNIWVARKNGKTGLAAVLSLIGLIKGEYDSETYFCATTKEQASQTLKYLKSMIRLSPVIRKKVRIYKYYIQYNLNGECTAKPVANEPDKLDGLSPSFAVVDEKHAFPDNDMFNIMKTGTLARENPMIMTISTAGFHKDYPFYNETEVGKKILGDEVQDDSTFYAYYTLDDEEEVEDTNMWVKANPSVIGEDGKGLISLSALKIDYEKACLVKSDKINFLTKNLNLFTDGIDTWIPDEDYKLCFNEVPIEELLGGECYLGFDLSKSIDLTSLVAVVKHPKTGRLHVLPEFYFPTKKNDENKIRASGIDLTEWIEKGFIEAHDEKRCVDEDRVFSRIEWYVNNFDVVSLGYDQWNTVQLIEKIKAELAVDCIVCKQNTAFYSFPMKYAERLIYEEGISMSRNPVLRWNFMNTGVYMDANANIKPDKNKSLDSIDGTVAFLMALGMYANSNFDAISSIMIDYVEQLNS